MMTDFLLHQVLRHLDRVLDRLTGIEQALDIERTEMTEVEDQVAAIQAQVADLGADLGRELTDLTDAVAHKLNDAEKARFADLAQQLTGLKDQIDTADPAPAPADNPPAA